MLSVWMILFAIIVLCFSGLPACLMPSRFYAMQRVTALLVLMGSAFGLCGVAASFGTASPSLNAQWFLPWGRFAVTVDAISAVFLVPVFVVPALGAIYGLGYWKQAEHQDNGRRLGLFYGILAGSMALVSISRDGILFLIAWEIMAMTAYFAVTVDDDNAEVRRAGWVYLIATHVGTLCLFAMFALWQRATGTFSLESSANMPSEIAGAIFVLSLIGFGCKAGIMPLHVWLPGAHANAPSHVSAVMSGVMLKMGVYGIVRMTSLLSATPTWWGGAMLVAGAVTGIAGIAFAIGQHDIKRMLAYSSIENIGIIMIGIGLAMLGRSQQRADWVMLGFCGAMLHVWNHAIFKSLLFFNAGAIIHAVHTRDIDKMGGLAKRMPRVMALFTVGAVAICALPPLNGFVSEWLMYVGLFRTLGIDGTAGYPVAALALIAIAIIGALAVACFVKLLGAVFLGSARVESREHAYNPPASMIWPMVILAAGCGFIGLFPALIIAPLEAAAGEWAVSGHATISDKFAQLAWISRMGLCMAGLLAVIGLAVKLMMKFKTVRRAGTWDCGYSQPTSRIQYTGSSFGQMLVEFFSFILWPKSNQPTIRKIFPSEARFKSFVPDAVLERIVMPAFHVAGKFLPELRILQQGKTQLYLLYIMIIVIVLLLCGTIGVKP